MTLGRRLRPLLVALPVIGILALAAMPALAAEIDVSIVKKAFAPTEINVAVGDTVTWTVTEAIGEPHSVKSGKPEDANAGSLFDSGIEGLKDNGQTFEFRFDQPGTVDYFCVVHAEMIGKVIVSAAAGGGGGAGAEGGEGIPAENRLLAAVILGVTIILGFGAAMVWRRMNPA